MSCPGLTTHNKPFRYNFCLIFLKEMCSSYNKFVWAGKPARDHRFTPGRTPMAPKQIATNIDYATSACGATLQVTKMVFKITTISPYPSPMTPILGTTEFQPGFYDPHFSLLLQRGYSISHYYTFPEIPI